MFSNNMAYHELSSQSIVLLGHASSRGVVFLSHISYQNIVVLGHVLFQITKLVLQQEKRFLKRSVALEYGIEFGIFWLMGFCVKLGPRLRDQAKRPVRAGCFSHTALFLTGSNTR